MRQTTSCRADPPALSEQFSCPPPGSYVAVSGQDPVAVVTWHVAGGSDLVGACCTRHPSLDCPTTGAPCPPCQCEPEDGHDHDRRTTKAFQISFPAQAPSSWRRWDKVHRDREQLLKALYLAAVFEGSDRARAIIHNALKCDEFKQHKIGETLSLIGLRV